MIFAQQGRPFTAVLFNADAGLTDLEVQILDAEPGAGTVLYGPSATGVVPVPSLPGAYRVVLTTPDVPGDGLPLFVVWTSATFGSIAEELVVSLEPAPAGAGSAPSVAEVASFLRARTRNANGVELGTFTSDTRPTDRQVRDMIRIAYADVATVIGFVETSVALAQVARSVVAIGAALLVELSYFPEQVNSGRSPYDQLKAMYDDRFARLTIDAHDGVDDPATDHVNAGLATWRVPDHCMTRFDTPL